MKKIITYFLLALLILAPVESFARTRLLTSSPVYKGTITGMRISAVDGTAFIDGANASVTALADGNHSIEIYDSSNRMLKGCLKAAGTSETLDGTKVANGTFDSDTLWGSHVNWTIADGVATAANTNSNLQQTLVTTDGILLKSTFDWTHTGGVLSADMESTPASTYTTSGAKEFYRTVGTNKKIRFYGGSASGALDNVTSKQVLTPSALGATIVSAKAGETYNWTYKNPNFTYNAASYYVVIKKIVGEVTVASGDITAGNALIDSTTANAFAAPVGVDLSAYQTGKYRLDLYQTSTGVLWAQGFISATAPSGLALSATDLASGWNITNWTLGSGNVSITDADTYVSTAGAGIYKNLGLVSQRLYQFVIAGTVSAGFCRLLDFDGTSYNPNAFGTTYGTWKTTNRPVYLYNSAAATTDITTLQIKQVTMPAATGALLLSSYGGSRGFVFKHASFDPNAALSYKIVKVID